MTESARKTEMAKAYDPSKVEAALYQRWLDGGYFRARIDPDRDPFCIIMPPPNVTGELHLGHALEDSITDCLVRWHRMRGDPTLWLPGVDHAGIATQNVVEKELAKEGLTRQDLGRDQFVERVWAWVRKYRGVISHQHARLGASCDWEREVFTMDAGPQKAVRTTFVKLHSEGLIYRGERIINWCPRCQTALSDLEVEHEEQDGNLWYVRYPFVEEGGETRPGQAMMPSSEYIVIATTRPETIVADVAVAVNPTVERWKGFVGRKALLPIIERQIPIIADGQVEAEFGTGALKITPGHDSVDFEIGERHGLPAIVAVAADGTMVHRLDGWHEAKCVTCWWEDDKGHRQSRYAVRLETAEQFKAFVWSLACQCGLERATEVVLLGDGAAWIWDHLAGILGERTICITDWYHVIEQVWNCGKQLHGEGSAATEDWVKKLETWLWEGNWPKVLEELEQQHRQMRSPRKRSAIASLRTYLSNQADRLSYGRFRQMGLDIGSGPVEAACKHVVQSRMKRSGMRWSLDGAQRTLSLRSVWLNGQWNDFWQTAALAA